MATIRSSFTVDGQRLFLEECANGFQLQTRWYRIGKPFSKLPEAITAFEVLEFCEGDLRKVFRSAVSIELVRAPASRIAGPAMARTWLVLSGVENRLNGLRPQSCGSKSANIKWVQA